MEEKRQQLMILAFECILQHSNKPITDSEFGNYVKGVIDLECKIFEESELLE